MPAKDFSSKVDKSSSPVINRVIQDNKGNQMPTYHGKDILPATYNKHTVSVPEGTRSRGDLGNVKRDGKLSPSKPFSK